MIENNRSEVRESRGSFRDGSQRGCSEEVTINWYLKDDRSQLWRGERRELQVYGAVSAQM